MNNLPFGFDRPEDSPGFLLWQTTTLWQRAIKKALEAHKISHAQFVIMATLMWFRAHSYDTTQIAIVNQTKLDKMTVSKSLKKLVALGLVHRIEHEADTRAKNVTLTVSGEKLVGILVPCVEKIDAQFFGTLKDSQGLIKILGELITQNDPVRLKHLR